MEPGTQQLVVSVYAFAADCGQVTLHVLRMDTKSQKLQDALQLQNFCKLDGSVSGHSLLLDGPYYAKGAALCCPTKNDAHAAHDDDVLDNSQQTRTRHGPVYQNAEHALRCSGFKPHESAWT